MFLSIRSKLQRFQGLLYILLFSLVVRHWIRAVFSGNCTSGLKVLCCYRIALQEETNRMSANALAIVFAPCILRCPDSIDPLQSVQDISKTTAYAHKLTLQFYSHYSLNARNLVYCCNYSLITSKCNCIFGLMSTKKTSASYILKRGFSRKTNISLSKCVQAYHRVPEHLCSVCFQFKWLSGPQVCGADHQRADEQVQGSSEGHQQSGVCREQSQEQADPHQEVHGKIKVQ